MNITDHADGQPAGMVQRSTQDNCRPPVSTMYRLLAADGGCPERRNQLTPPAYAKPECVFRRT